MEGHGRQRDTVVDHALRLCAERGYGAVTMAEVAHAAELTEPHVLEIFPTLQNAVLAPIADILHASANTLNAETGGTGTDPAAALHAATTDVLAHIAAGDGVIPHHRLTQVAHVLTATPELRVASRVLRFDILVPALAHHLGVSTTDRVVTHAVLMWSAVIAASYNPAYRQGKQVEPHRDGRRPEIMVDRLSDTFPRILGRRPVPEHRTTETIRPISPTPPASPPSDPGADPAEVG